MPQRVDAAQPLSAEAAPPAPPDTLAEIVDKVFSRVDANADGAISLEEALNAIDPGGTSSSLVTQFQRLGSSIDGDADGSLSKDELSAAILAHQVTPERLPDPGSWNAAANDAAYEEQHSDDDAGAAGSSNVMLSLFGSSGRTIDFAALASGVFAQIDSNADNTLSADEVAAAVALVDASSIDAGVLSTLDTSAIASIVTHAAHPDQPLDHFDQLSVELIGVLARALNPQDCGG